MRVVVPVLLLVLSVFPSSAQTVVVRAGHLIDVANGRVIANQSILVEDGTITAV